MAEPASDRSKNSNIDSITREIREEVVARLKHDMPLLASDVQQEVLKQLKYRYLAFVLLLSILAPVIGFLLGFAIENSILKNTIATKLDTAQKQIDKSVGDAEARVNASVENAKRAADSTTENLVEARANRIALESIIKGTDIGDLTKLDLKRDDLTRKIADVKRTLEQFEKQLGEEFPTRIRQLRDLAVEMERTEAAVTKLEGLFGDKKLQANALARAVSVPAH